MLEKNTPKNYIHNAIYISRNTIRINDINKNIVTKRKCIISKIVSLWLGLYANISQILIFTTFRYLLYAKNRQANELYNTSVYSIMCLIYSSWILCKFFNIVIIGVLFIGYSAFAFFCHISLGYSDRLFGSWIIEWRKLVHWPDFINTWPDNWPTSLI